MKKTEVEVNIAVTDTNLRQSFESYTQYYDRRNLRNQKSAFTDPILVQFSSIKYNARSIQ